MLETIIFVSKGKEKELSSTQFSSTTQAKGAGQLASDELDLLRGEEQAGVGLAAHVHGVDVRGVLPFQVHDVLMVEVLIGSPEVFAVSKRDSALTIWVTSCDLPNFSNLALLVLPGLITNKAELEEYLGHLCAANLCVVNIMI